MDMVDERTVRGPRNKASARGSSKVRRGHYACVTVASKESEIRTGDMSSPITSRILHIETGLLSGVSVQRTGNVDDIHPLSNKRRERVAFRSRANPQECAA